MKTDDLINMLASGVTPIDRHAPTKRVGVAMLIGSLSATIPAFFKVVVASTV